MYVLNHEVTEKDLDRFEGILDELEDEHYSPRCPFNEITCSFPGLCTAFVPDLRKGCPCNSKTSPLQLIRIVTMILRQNGRKV